MKIYTKTGDEGDTGLFFGGRVSKNDIRCIAYGAIDETVSALGLSRALCNTVKIKQMLFDIQNELFTVGAELATLRENYQQMSHSYKIVDQNMVMRIEQLIDVFDAEMELPPNFILPGTSSGSSAIDLARSVLRRSERAIVDLKSQGMLNNSQVLKYVNRLSDLLFMMARYEDKDISFEVISGQKLDD